MNKKEIQKIVDGILKHKENFKKKEKNKKPQLKISYGDYENCECCKMEFWQHDGEHFGRCEFCDTQCLPFSAQKCWKEK